MTTNILITCVGRRNYLINYFKEALNGRGKVYASDIDAHAPAMIEADIAFVVPSVHNNNYISSLIKIINNNNINAVISLNDFELPILSKHKAHIESQTNAKIIISNEHVIDLAYDKFKTYNFLNSIGVNTPKTYINLESILPVIKESLCHFPLVVKDRWGSASLHISFANSMEELEMVYKIQLLQLQSIVNNSGDDDKANNPIIIQEKMTGKEYGMDILNDFDGNYVGTFVREKLSMRYGETERAISVIDPRFDEIGIKISKELKHVGSMDCDLFEYNNELYVLELNPRFGGGYPFSHEAGINIAAIYVEWINNKKEISKFNNYKENILFSKCDRMLKISK